MTFWIRPPLPRRALRLCLSLSLSLSLSLAAATAADAPIELPPLEVVADTVTAKPWRYAAYAGGEVLSRLSDSATREFLEAHHRLQQVVAQVLPASLQGRRAVPDILILTPRGAGGGLSKELVARAAAEHAQHQPATPDPVDGLQAGRQIRIFDNLRLNDIDSTVVYAVIDEFSFHGATFQFTPDQLAFLVGSRVPRLPEWFTTGILALFQEAKFTGDTIAFGRAQWAPRAEAESIAARPDSSPPLLPMHEILERPCPPAEGATLAAAQKWRAQAALFVRWMIESEPRRAPLWSLATRAAEGPLDEALCRQITGLDYLALSAQLSEYVRPAMLRDGLKIKAPKLEPSPSLALRDATALESARIRGDWERLEVNWVRARQPRFLDQYVAQARRTLTQAHDRGERAPALLAVLGLLHCDLGDDAAALPFLEAAVAARVVRPRAYLELARIRYLAALKNPQGGNRLLSSAQVNVVLEPFKTGFDQAPPLLESCRLIAEAWSHSTATLGPAQLALCDRALGFFPRDPALLYNVAAIKIFHGQTAEATTLLRRGLALSDTPATKARFEKMLTSLAAQ